MKGLSGAPSPYYWWAVYLKSGITKLNIAKGIHYVLQFNGEYQFMYEDPYSKKVVNINGLNFNKLA